LRAAQPTTRHNVTVSDLTKRIDDLAGLIDEYGLESASLKGEGWKVAFDKNPPSTNAVYTAGPAPATPSAAPKAKAEKKKPEGPRGTPISSPMMGIFYSSPSPGSPNFCKEGDTVAAGDVVGLIEAMKVFNEMTTPVSGRVAKVCVENGQLVQPGDPLVYVE
jgi:acetyl-CoA carboxylase biotin carboxyl carrier protein